MESLREEAKRWNLGSDKLLIQYLQSIGKNILNSTSRLQNNLEKLIYESKAAEVKINNCFNHLLILGNSQFIENVRALAQPAPAFNICCVDMTLKRGWRMLPPACCQICVHLGLFRLALHLWKPRN